LGFEELFNKKLSKLFSNFSFEMLTDINWNEKLCNFDDVDDVCEEFSKTFLQISSECIPSHLHYFPIHFGV
jgi:hypothetical protein